MKFIAAFFLTLVISGCAELVSYAVGTLGNVTGDLIMREIIDDKKDTAHCDPMGVRNCPKEK
jgi:hypothetical protein